MTENDEVSLHCEVRIFCMVEALHGMTLGNNLMRDQQLTLA